MKGDSIVNAQQITKIIVIPERPNSELTRLMEGCGNWEWQEYKKVKRLFRKPKLVHKPGWYGSSNWGADIPKERRYIATDEELLEYLNNRFTSKYFIKEVNGIKELYRYPQIIIFRSDDNRDKLYFSSIPEAEEFLKELKNKLPDLISIYDYVL